MLVKWDVTPTDLGNLIRNRIGTGHLFYNDFSDSLWNIPECNIYATGTCSTDDCKPPEAMLKHVLVEASNVALFLADNEGRKVFNATYHSPRLPLERGFVPYNQADISSYFDENPVSEIGIDDKRFDLGGLHAH